MDGNIEKMQSLTGRIKALGIDTTLTKKGMCAEAKATGEALATKVNITDIVDELTSVAVDKPLSANQGRVLKKQIDDIDPHTAENVVYDNADSGVDANNVKVAIDKLSKAESINFDKNTSGLNSDNVQGAIDEVSENVTDVQTQLNNFDLQVFTMDVGLDFYIQGKIGILHFEGYTFAGNTSNELSLIKTDSYKPKTNVRASARFFDNTTSVSYDCLLKLTDNGVLSGTYLTNNGTAVALKNGLIHGTMVFVCK